MSRSRRLLIRSGILLALLAMSYGFVYAVWIEHQTLDALGGNLATAFMRGAERNLPEAHRAMDAYSATAYNYVRQVDVHSHWAGLGLLLVLLGIFFDRVGFAESKKFALAASLTLGSILFPLGVFLETMDHGNIPKAIAVVGSGLIILGLAGVGLGFLRAPVEGSTSGD